MAALNTISPVGVKPPSQASVPQEGRCLRLERSSDPAKIKQRNVPLASLDLAHVGPINSGCIGKRFLRQSEVLTAEANYRAKRL
jgi:hypothetical protein